MPLQYTPCLRPEETSFSPSVNILRVKNIITVFVKKKEKKKGRKKKRQQLGNIVKLWKI